MKKLLLIFAVILATTFANAEPFMSEMCDTEQTSENQKTLVLYSQYNTLLVEGADDGETIEIYSITGQRVLVDEIHEGRVDISPLKKGIYIARVGQRTAKFTVK